MKTLAEISVFVAPNNTEYDIKDSTARGWKGAANGVAELDSNGKVPSSQLPSYVDDVEEYDAKDFASWAEWVGGTSYAVGDKAKITDNGTVTGYICKTANSSAVFDPTEWDEATKFPIAGEDGKIYIAKDTNITYRWGGSAYVPIGSDLALGETSSTAYRGDRGKAAYDAAVVNPDATPTENSTNLVQSGGVYTAVSAKYTKPTNGIPATDLADGVIPGDMTGATASSNGTHGLVPAPDAGEQSLVLMGNGNWEMPPNARLDSVTMTVTNTSGAYSGTVSSDEITPYSAPIRIEVGNPSAFGANINVAPGNGQFTVTCSDV